MMTSISAQIQEKIDKLRQQLANLESIAEGTLTLPEGFKVFSVEHGQLQIELLDGSKFVVAPSDSDPISYLNCVEKGKYFVDCGPPWKSMWGAEPYSRSYNFARDAVCDSPEEAIAYWIANPGSFSG